MLRPVCSADSDWISTTDQMSYRYSLKETNTLVINALSTKVIFRTNKGLKIVRVSTFQSKF